MNDFLSWLRAEWDRAAGVGLIVVGAGALVAGYAGVADASYTPQALSFIASGGLFGLFFTMVGATLLVVAALHDEWRKLDRIEQALNLRAGAPPAEVHLDEEAANGRNSGAAAVALCSGPALAVLGGGLAAAVVLMVGGWQATAGTAENSRAYTTLAVGVGGLILAGTVAARWTVRLRGLVRRRQRRLLAPLSVPQTERERHPDAPGDSRVAVAAGLTRYHLPHCAALRDLAVRLVTPADASGAGLAACRLCSPAAAGPP